MSCPAKAFLKGEGGGGRWPEICLFVSPLRMAFAVQPSIEVAALQMPRSSFNKHVGPDPPVLARTALLNPVRDRPGATASDIVRSVAMPFAPSPSSCPRRLS